MGTAGRTALDVYLDWTPILAIAIGSLVFLVRRSAFPVALPMLLLWAGSKPLSLWLNRPPRAPNNEASEADRAFLRRSALRTWRYFAEFSTKEHNWLIPDNVQEKPPAVAARMSLTNLGLLLNVRQVACEFGYLTIPESAPGLELAQGARFVSGGLEIFEHFSARRPSAWPSEIPGRWRPAST